MKRREARAIALELLFEYDFNREKKPEDIIELAEIEREIKVNSFARQIFLLAASNIEEVDELISSKAENWRLDRISRLAKAVMRLCVSEIIYVGTPDRVALNEAVELAKAYDDEKGASFINGVLGGIVRALPGYDGEDKIERISEESSIIEEDKEEE